MKRTVWLMLTFVTALLTGCPNSREVVNFDTDPRVLRGSWNFVLSNALSTPPVTTIVVEFTPTLMSDYYYTVTASVLLEGEVYALSGMISQRNTTFVSPQFYPAPEILMTLTGQTTGNQYYVQIPLTYQLSGRWIFSGKLSGKTKYWELEISRN